MLSTLKDQTDILYDVSNEPQAIIQSSNDGWGYGFFLDHIPSSVTTPTGTIAGNAFAIGTSSPVAGQIKVHYSTPHKIGWVECNSADVGKTVVISYKGQGQAWNSKRANAAHAEINDHETRIATLEAAGGGFNLTWQLSPASGSAGAPVTTNLNASFNKHFLQATATGTEAKLYPTADDRTNDTNAIAASVSFTDGYILTINPTSDLPDNEDYFVRIFSGLKFADGDSLANNIDYSVVVGSINQAPSVPSGLAASSITTTGFTLDWSDSTDPESNTPIVYNVFKDGVRWPDASTTFASSTANVTGQTVGSSATWTVSAVDSLGAESAQSSGLSVTTKYWTTSKTNLTAESAFSISSGILTGTAIAATNGVSGNLNLKSSKSYNVSAGNKKYFEVDIQEYVANAVDAPSIQFKLIDGSNNQVIIHCTTERADLVFTPWASQDFVALSSSTNRVKYKIALEGNAVEWFRNGVSQGTYTHGTTFASVDVYLTLNEKLASAFTRTYDNFKVYDSDGTTIIDSDDFTTQKW